MTDQTPSPTIAVAGVQVPITYALADGEVSADEWNLAQCTSGTTLTAACRGEALPVSGTNAAKAARLVKAGLTKAQVEERYGWKARRGV